MFKSYDDEVYKAKMKLKNMPTKTIVKKYQTYGTDGKLWARQELKKRKVPAKQLPFKKRTAPRRSGLGMSMGGFFR